MLGMNEKGRGTLKWTRDLKKELTMKIHEIKVDHEPREVRTFTLGIGLIQMIEEACVRMGSANTGSAREATYRSIARQLAEVRSGTE